MHKSFLFLVSTLIILGGTNVVAFENVKEVKSYNNVGVGYLFSEPIGVVYPVVNEDVNNTNITLCNGAKNAKYVLVVTDVVEEDYKNYSKLANISNKYTYELASDECIEIANESFLYTNNVYYLYEIN